jgi:hypothetical protein
MITAADWVVRTEELAEDLEANVHEDLGFGEDGWIDDLGSVERWSFDVSEVAGPTMCGTAPGTGWWQ